MQKSGFLTTWLIYKYTVIFKAKENGQLLDEGDILTATHNLCFRAKIKKIISQFYYLNLGLKES